MHSINIHVLGTVMLILWLAQWAIMALGPGGFPRDKHSVGVIAKVYNVLNMVTVLIVMPVVAVLLLTGYVIPLEMTRVPLQSGSSPVSYGDHRLRAIPARSLSTVLGTVLHRNQFSNGRRGPQTK